MGSKNEQSRVATGFEMQRIAANAKDPDIYRELEFSSARVDKARALVRDLPAGLRILDVGCADGAMLESFVGRLEVHGVDASEELVSAARSKGLHAQVADGENLPYADGSFDAAFAGEVIEHTISPDRFLHEINRILRPGGVLILTVPNIRTPIGIAMLLYGLPPMFAARYRSSHFRDFTARLLKLALRNNGFEVVRFLGSAFTVPRYGPKFSFLANLAPSWADNFIVKAVKVSNSHYDRVNEFLPL